MSTGLGIDATSHPPGEATLEQLHAGKGLPNPSIGFDPIQTPTLDSGVSNNDKRTDSPPLHTPNDSTNAISHGSSVDCLKGIDRHGTLLSVGAPPGRNAAELNAILGSSNARLRNGATLLPPPGHKLLPKDRTAFEQARSKARVDVDLVPYSNVCVQGGHLHGHIRINIHTRKSHKETPMMIGDGKVRLIGFECISYEKERYPFYQCSAKLSEAAPNFAELFDSPLDSNGFALAKEGEFTLPFSMHIPLSTEYGLPKGILNSQAGVAIRYIAMVSLKCKEFGAEKSSIAHFYRNCEVWPRLNPATILAPAKVPITMSTSKGSFSGSSGNIALSVTLHRPCWVAGQVCTAHISVDNDTKKIVKGVTLALIRSVIIFKPHRRLDTLIDGEYIADPDACQTFTSHKQVAESVLDMGHRGSTARQVSAKGWWTGVHPGERREFAHSVHVPQGTLSICRSQLLEVNYSLQVTLHAGPLQTLDAQVILPIRIINFLSIDPPPSPLPLDLCGETFDTHMRSSSADGVHCSPLLGLGRGEPRHFAEENEEGLESGSSINDNRINPSLSVASVSAQDKRNYKIDPHLEMYEPAPEESTDEEDCNTSAYPYDDVQLFVDPDYEDPPRFADLYYQSTQEESMIQPTISGALDHAQDEDAESAGSEIPWPPVEPSTVRQPKHEILGSRPSVPSLLCHRNTTDSDQPCCPSEDASETMIETTPIGVDQSDDRSVLALGEVEHTHNDIAKQGADNSVSRDSDQIFLGSDHDISVKIDDIHPRSLPKPPSLLPPSTSEADSLSKERGSIASNASASTGSRYSHTSPNSGHVGSDFVELQSDQHTTTGPAPHDAEGNRISLENTVRPLLEILGKAASGSRSTSGSSNSVKERIRELEKRQKHLKQSPTRAVQD